MPSADVRDAVLFLAPGFVALWVYQTYAFRRPRTDWHWLVWSIIASLPIDFLARAALGDPETGISLNFADVSLRAALAIALGAGLGLGWRWLRTVDHPRARRFVARFTDSILDDTLERAHNEDRTIEVVAIDGTRYVGHFNAAREDAAAEPWIYLVDGYWRRTMGADDWEQPNGGGMLIHRDQIRQVTIGALPAVAPRA